MNKYQKALESELKSIRDGKIPVGAPLDSVRTLAKKHKISEPTAYRVVSELRNLGIIESRGGSGSFVIRTEPQKLNNQKPLNNGDVALFHLKDYNHIMAAENYDADIIRHAENALKGFGLELKVITYPDIEKQPEFIADYIKKERDTKGVLLFSMGNREDTRKSLIHCEKKNVKTVCLAEGFRTELFGIPSVTIDETAAGFLGMEILLEKDVTKGAVIMPEKSYLRQSINPYYLIAKGAETAWLAAGMPEDGIIFDGTAPDCMQWSGYKAVKQLLSNDKSIKGLIFTHQLLAEGGIEYLVENGIEIGKDIEVVGIPRWRPDAFWGPDTVHWIEYSYTDMGREAGLLLGRRISGQDEVKRIRIQPRIAIKGKSI